MGIKKEFGEKVKGFKEYVVLTTVAAEKYQATNIEIIRYLVSDQKIPGVYVTLNKPFEVMQGIFKNKKINLDMIIFIDAITKISGGSFKKQKHCLFIGSPENLSDVSIAMDQAVTAIPGDKKFLFFDSLSTLLLYNKPEVVARFIHFLSGKMRIWKVKGIIISLDREADKDLISQLSQFCDATIDF